jgi:hypothetical protein
MTLKSKLVSFFVIPFLPLFLISALNSTRINKKNILERTPIELSEVLAKAANYCSRLNSAVLDFICQEHIRERFYFNFRLGKYFAMNLIETNAENHFLYDYQMIRRNKKTREKRNLLQANNKSYEPKEAPLLTTRFAHERVIFGPIGLLDASWQPCFDFRLVEKTSWNGIPALVVEAVPNGKKRVPHLYGKIWINSDSGSILRIEWASKSLGGYEDLIRLANRFRANAVITFSSEYAHEIGGLRFPSKYSITEKYVLNEGQKIQVVSKDRLRWIDEFVLSETEVIYSDYKFFTVETEVEIRN